MARVPPTTPGPEAHPTVRFMMLELRPPVGRSLPVTVIDIWRLLRSISARRIRVTLSASLSMQVERFI
jgi:hypothetical protein